MILRTSVRVKMNPELLKRTCTKAEHEVAVQAERDTRRYIPSRTGRLRSSGKVTGNTIAWELPYASIQYFGVIYEDPKYHTGGIPTKDGWRSRPGVRKVRSNRKFSHANGGDMWFQKAKEANRAKWLQIARRCFNG